MDLATDVLIVGGGLAGLSAAIALAPRGLRVLLLEARGRLGGRAGSFRDPATGQLIDVCQHVSMGCCTNFAHFCRTLGLGGFLAPQPRLYFMTPDRKVSRFGAAPWPAPLHLARSFLAAHFLTPMEKVRIGWGLTRLQRASENQDPPFAEWLARNGQTPRTIDRFWGLVLVSALNESPYRVGLRYARKVFLDGFMRHPRGFEVEIPTVPLDRLYGPELRGRLENHGVDLRFHQGARRFLVREDRVDGVEMRDGSVLRSRWYVAAVPFERLLDLLPGETVAAHEEFSGLRHLRSSPIVSVHLWYDRPVLSLPHVVLVDCQGQWVFDRGPQPDGSHYLQVVVSAARELRELGNEETARRIAQEMEDLFPLVRHARLLRQRTLVEHAATFSAVPGVDRWRPKQATGIENLFLAGDWTATGWPATMEGAVRSGYLAGEALLARSGSPERLVQPDLT